MLLALFFEFRIDLDDSNYMLVQMLVEFVRILVLMVVEVMNDFVVMRIRGIALELFFRLGLMSLKLVVSL